MLATIAAGLAVRFAPLGLPPFVMKYGGSTLWALMFYWIVSTLLPSPRLPAVALLAAGLATGVEFVKLYHSPGLDAFRLTLPGALLLGASSPAGTSPHTGSPSLPVCWSISTSDSVLPGLEISALSWRPKDARLRMGWIGTRHMRM